MPLKWIGALITILILRMKIFMILLMFFVIGALLIISNNNLALYQETNMIKFKTSYFNWLDNVYNNFELMIEYLRTMKWLPENKNI